MQHYKNDLSLCLDKVSSLLTTTYTFVSGTAHPLHTIQEISCVHVCHSIMVIFVISAPYIFTTTHSCDPVSVT